MDMNAPYNVYADSYLKSKLFSQNQFQSAFALQRTFVMYKLLSIIHGTFLLLVRRY